MSASKNARGSEVGKSIARDEAIIAAAEVTRFAVFGCRGRRTIGCLLTKGGDVGEDSGNEVPCCNGKEEKSTARFKPAEGVEEESAVSKRLAADVGLIAEAESVAALALAE
jgi:hypothetical protein